MRKFFTVVWLQIVFLLAMAALTLAVPEPNLWRFIGAGVLVLVTTFSVYFKLLSLKVVTRVSGHRATMNLCR